MKHHIMQNLLISYLDGEVSEEQSAEVRQHLRKCKACRELHHTLSHLWQEEIPETRVSPPPDLWHKVQARIEAESRQRVWTRLREPVRLVLQPVAAAVIILLAVFVGLRVGEQFSSPSEPAITELREEFRMDYFTAVPFGAVGESYIVQTSAESEQ